MVFEHIEKLKREYTDKYVEIAGDRPELMRFKGFTGTVRTVNMSGRALVEFPVYNNIGWYDIDVDYLRVVDAPKEPEPAEEKPAKKPAAKKADTGKAAAEPKAGGSAADLLAAASKGGATAKKSDSKAKTSEKKAPAENKGSLSLAERLAAAQGGSKSADKPAPAKASGGSIADMLASAGGETAEAPPETETEEEPAEEPAAAAEEAPAEDKPAGGAAGPVKVDVENMSIQEMLTLYRDQNG